jgi:uncharacterized caspase-like protein
VRQDDPDILSRLFDLRYLMGKLAETAAHTRLVILDACRSNIFSSHPSAASGLSELIAPPGTFVAFSTAPGATADDGDGDNSPYTLALLERLFMPGVRIEEAFKEVRRLVRRLTGDAQTPWESTSLDQDFFLVPAAGSSSRAPANGQSTTFASAANEVPARGQSGPGRSRGPGIDRNGCSQLLTRLSLGASPLSAEDKDRLNACR